VPILHDDMSRRPDWCELEEFRIVALVQGSEHVWRASHQANKLVVVEGQCRVTSAHGAYVVDRGGVVDVSVGEHELRAGDPATVVELGGHWGAECGRPTEHWPG
jgi:hypothetical protein